MDSSTGFARHIWYKNDISISWRDHISPRLNIVGAENARKGWVDPQRVIYDHELMLLGEGGEFAFDLEDVSGRGHTIGCNGPSYIIIPPGVWHTCRGIVCEGVSRAWIHFDWVAAARVSETPILTYRPAPPLAHLFRPAPPFVPPGIFSGPLLRSSLAFDLHARITERFNHNSPSERATSRALLLELLLCLLTPDTGPSRAASAPLAGQVREALDELARKPFAQAEAIRPYLRGLGHSYDHLARLFRSAYGVTPLQYLNAQRIERAKILLRDTSWPVARVSRHLGFRDAVYFNRLFRTVAGVTPGRWAGMGTD